MKKLAGILIILTMFVILPSVVFFLLGSPWYAWIALLALVLGVFLLMGVFYKITVFGIDLILGDK